MVYVHFAEGFEEIEAITIVDVLRRADIGVKMVSVTGSLSVTGSHGIVVNTDSLFEEADYNLAAMIVLPGGLPGAHNLKAHEGLMQKIQEFKAKGKWLGAVCAAPYILGELGVLQGELATCYPGFEKHLKGAMLVYEPAVISGKTVTGRGAGPSMKFALKIVEALKDEETARELGRKMLVQE
jgi:4-methyl-5(b-hydroxyethyl)-thiazole monophosphate biosynthesis